MRKKAFTLIELMVIVAVIATLATLGVTNFTESTKKARDAKRMADIQAVAKALETCYDISSGIYGANVGGFISGAAKNIDVGAIWDSSTISCLGSPVKPSLTGKQYYVTLKDVTDGAKLGSFCTCAQMEKKENGNSTDSNCNMIIPTLDNESYFCLSSSQGTY